MRSGISNSLLSGRAQDRLYQLQRALTMELRALNAQQSLLQGALQACDIGTQSSFLQDYLERVNSVLEAVVRLRTFVARHHDNTNQPESDLQSKSTLENGNAEVAESEGAQLDSVTLPNSRIEFVD